MPRFPYAPPSPAWSPTSCPIARSCAWFIGTRWPWKSPPATYTQCRRCSRQTKHSPASKSARRLPPPWLRASAMPRPAAKPSASLPGGSQRQCAQPLSRALALVPGLPRLDLAATERAMVRVGERERGICVCLCLCAHVRALLSLLSFLCFLRL